LYRARRKFDEWAKRVRASLRNKSKTALNRLPEECRWLRYWGAKLRDEEPSSYREIEKIEMDLLNKSAKALYKDYLGYLEKAKKHGRGTKIRLTEISRFAYYYGNYVHSCFIAAGRKDTARKVLESFWKTQINEIIEYADGLEENQVQWILRIAKQSRDVGLKIDQQWISKLEALIVQPSDPLLLEQCKAQLGKAGESLTQENTIAALILADQSLEIFLKGLCIRFGCREDSRSDRGKSFGKWGLMDYLHFLDEIGELAEIDKRNFYDFHEWRNCAQHKGLEPSVRIVKKVIEEIKKFVEEHSR